MPWVKVPPENHPKFYAALPKDSRIETMKMFGGVAATVRGHLFASLFGRSTMVRLPEPDRTAALALNGAAPFDPMGNGRVRSDKVMLPESLMQDPMALREWIERAFRAAAMLPKKAAKTAPVRKATKRAPSVKKKTVVKRSGAKHSPKKRMGR